MKRWIVCALAAMMAVQQSSSCCAVTLSGNVVEFVGQVNVIIWDPATKTEHFIRNASFKTKAGDLGFIAPTPTRPELGEADKAIFRFLAKRSTLFDGPAAGGGLKTGGSPASITVVQVKDVAGFRATTILATSSSDLAAWMKENKYATSPDIEKWTEFYVKKGWFLTLFKVLNEQGTAETGPVRMSFKTDKPFNPYLVPSVNDSKDKGGLALYFVGPGEFGIENKPSDRIPYVERKGIISEGDRTELAKLASVETLPHNLKITSFVDPNFPNVKATDDLYFKRIGDGPTEPPPVPIVVYSLVGIFGAAALWFIWRRGRLTSK